MKIITTAAALEYGGAKFSNTFDASKPIQVGRYTIKDFRGKNRVLTLPEGFIYSSNIVMVKMAIGFGGAIQRKFLRQLNMTIRPQIEVPEVAMPMVPSEKRWQESTIMTVSYGYGTAFSPVTVMDAIAALIKDGNYVPSTILRNGRKKTVARKVISKLNSRKLRHLMRLAVTHGTVRKANVAGYQVIAKTGTANKAFTGGRRRGYNMKERLASCIAAFPMDNPRYIVYAGLDSPQGLKETYGFTAGGWNAAPTVGKIIKAVAPMLGFAQVVDPETARMLQRQNPAIKYIRMNHATR
jgi:cell division protein FtsI (penicillin-binding protein 3)